MATVMETIDAYERQSSRQQRAEQEFERPIDVQSAPLTHEQIAVRAYGLWQERGCPDGSPDVDWFRAEQELQMVAEANTSK